MDDDFNFEDDVAPLRGNHFHVTRPESGVPLNRFRLRAQTEEALGDAAIHRERMNMQRQSMDLRLAKQRYDYYQNNMKAEREALRRAKEASERVPLLIDSLSAAIDPNTPPEQAARIRAEAVMKYPKAAATPEGRAVLEGQTVDLNSKVAKSTMERQEKEAKLQRVYRQGAVWAEFGEVDELKSLMKENPDADFSPFMRQALTFRQRQEEYAKSKGAEQARDFEKERQDIQRQLKKDSFTAIEGLRLIDQPDAEDAAFGESSVASLNPGNLHRFKAEVEALIYSKQLDFPGWEEAWKRAEQIGADPRSDDSFEGLRAAVLGLLRQQGLSTSQGQSTGATKLFDPKAKAE